ncbi:MAG: hypothetical protein NC452_11705 [Eubacterium sp.]|nr:hypothetical protein [Eubacterium sp.]
MGLVKNVLNSIQNQYDKENTDNYILRCKNAEVLWYQPMKLIACVRFLEDKNKNEYHLYNRCGAYLAPGDEVKVYYTTNAAKGWIAVRNGVPNYLNEYGQNIADISNCCDDAVNDSCCDAICCSEAATRNQNKDTEVIEEWDERIEGTEEEIREYEKNEGKNNPFYIFSGRS